MVIHHATDVLGGCRGNNDRSAQRQKTKD